MPRARHNPVRWVCQGDRTNLAFADNLPELDMIGFDRFQEASPLPVHRHARCYEFVYVEHGKVTWETDDGHHPSHAGQCFHTKPGEWHRARSNYVEPSSIWWMILVDPSELPGWLGLRDEDRLRIRQALDSLPRIVNADIRVREQFLKLRLLLEQGVAEDAFRVRHHMLDIVLQLLYPPVARQLPFDQREAMARLAADIEAEPERRWTNNELAAKAGVSESYFYRLFQDVHGQSPASYIERMRMNRACVLLREPGSNITSVALDLGFKTSQHFATVFKKYIGVSPRQWRTSAE